MSRKMGEYKLSPLWEKEKSFYFVIFTDKVEIKM